MTEAQTVQGRTIVTEATAEKMVGILLSDFPGVKSLGSPMGRVMGTVLSLFDNKHPEKQGVTAKYERGRFQILVRINTSAGHLPHDVAYSVGETIFEHIEQLTGTGVSAVTVEVASVEVGSIDDLPAGSSSGAGASAPTTNNPDKNLTITYTTGAYEDVATSLIAAAYGVADDEVTTRVSERTQGLAISAKTPLAQRLLGNNPKFSQQDFENGSEALTRTINTHIESASPHLTAHLERLLGRTVESLSCEVSSLHSTTGGA
ncbi:MULTISPECIES: Asp23/Gls24 family envelope stress response protein [unclassified Rothia (in: high G+C Gram-positive bacteria)]|uniref:Asp23/Gls24 family envelope stress response protein n=1 Tax=unclassified Rothia (in: high G+C Gram-positive bacteria) TaxID=2689056 RepID=UPI00195BA172|nr:Asp23/Gls24 family envelope stress response protein [Rothia sp. ZJ932]MBM7051723.1 Asp23/Gls24 family envelope stress response protein [Rothia sp. ZJ1223]QRZ61656.1 Asp23/Gls24 family envelope stress response protein [Rothia sp. ZJ932]